MADQPKLGPSIIVIYGITGDLSQRYLLPALFHLIKEELLDPLTEIIGISRRDMTVDELLKDTKLCEGEPDNVCDPEALTRMHEHTRMLKMDVTARQDYDMLLKTLNDIEAEKGVCMNRLYYLSIPPAVYGPIIGLMGEAGLNASCTHGVAMTRLLVEKPFGYDLRSAEHLITETAKVFGEEQIYRIDHYLAKETVQNILTFRFQNPIFESLWNKDHISHIEISASEQIGIEGRAQFYEPIGALRDLIQSHLLQVLAIVTMDQPEKLDSDHIHASKGALMDTIHAVPADQVFSKAIRGQYQGYREEVNNLDSMTETFAAININIDSDRWRDVPVVIWTGKSLNEKKTEIVLTFNGQGEQPNQLRFRIQPNEGIELDLLTKQPGFSDTLQKVAMDFSYQYNFNNHDHPNAYERVLVDAVRGDHTLFATGGEVMSAWRIVQPVLDEWAKTHDHFETYAVGSLGTEIVKPLTSS